MNVCRRTANLVTSSGGCCRLGGGAYAAMSLPAGSVGARQIRNHVIDPVKFDPAAIGGAIRRWAQVSAQGTIMSSSGPAHIIGAPHDGGYVITWPGTFPKRSTPLAMPLAITVVGGNPSGFANAGTTSILVNTYNSQGQLTPLAFSLAVIC